MVQRVPSLITRTLLKLAHGHGLPWSVVIFNIIANQGPLCTLPGMCAAMVKWCTLHVVNLGVALWATGSCIRVLLSDCNVWKTADANSDEERLYVAFEHFRAWCSLHKIQYIGHTFSAAV